MGEGLLLFWLGGLKRSPFEVDEEEEVEEGPGPGILLEPLELLEVRGACGACRTSSEPDLTGSWPDTIGFGMARKKKFVVSIKCLGTHMLVG